LYWECLAGAQIILPESGRGLGHVIATIFGSTVGYPSDSLASCRIDPICSFCSAVCMWVEHLWKSLKHHS